MAFSLPPYQPPDFRHPSFTSAPVAVFRKVEKTGVAPENYHATSIYPEYIQIEKGNWRLLKASRMDCVVVQEPDAYLSVREFRNLSIGDRVLCGRRENGEDGIFVHTHAFVFPEHTADKFAFRTSLSRETSFSTDYDQLYELMAYERKNGFILWVLGPAVVFDQDARGAFGNLINMGFVHALLAGNALATHDVEGALFGTALGQGIYNKHLASLGHYHHLDALNIVRGIGSVEKAVSEKRVNNGIMRAIIRNHIPYVLAGSIRDDGPLPEVIADVYQAQDKMRALLKQTTTVISLATQLHSIATGNMLPSYYVSEDNQVRPVYFYTVDMSEFAVNKLADRGSLAARSILTNAQDFVVILERGLRRKQGGIKW